MRGRDWRALELGGDRSHQPSIIAQRELRAAPVDAASTLQRLPLARLETQRGQPSPGRGQAGVRPLLAAQPQSV